ncbi:MAG TPA: RNA polymerase sigma factor [Candidatus Polarisedimenticolaceae bacterium]|nr:RNA polymerase sigma factor [Candidatus Polarisedimenticolaceae bacterium]
MPHRSAEPAVPGQVASLSDEEVVARVVSGEVALFEMIMRRHNQRLFRTLRGLAPTDAEAEDILQEAYVQAYHHLAQFEGRARFSTWLTRIAIHEALARGKRRRRFTSLDEPDGQQARVERMRSSDPTPEERATSTELRGVLQRAIDRMPESLRVVFVMREVEGLDTEETADCLGLSAANVKVRLHRARALLRSGLDEELGTEVRQLHTFAGARCDALVASVLRRIDSRSGTAAP